jgi:hypothetical protein
MALRRGSRLLISIGFAITLPSTILALPAAHAAPVYDSQVKMGDPEDLDAIIGTLLEARENGHLAAATFKFLNTPLPASDGVLTVIVAGDLGIGLDDEGIVVEEDFIRVFPPGGAVLGILFANTTQALTAPGCPLVPTFDQSGNRNGKIENKGFLINQQGMFVDKNGQVLADQTDVSKRVFCGPSFHNAVDGLGMNAAGEGHHKDVPALDTLTIQKDELANLIVNGTISLTFEPSDPVGSLKYVAGADLPTGGTLPFAVRLTYVAVPQMPSLALVLLGAVGVGIWRSLSGRASVEVTPSEGG